MTDSFANSPADHPIEGARRAILLRVGEDPSREGLQNTPSRVRKMNAELLSGYTIDPASVVNGALFDIAYAEMVAVRDIEISSLCEHHLLPGMRGVRKADARIVTSAMGGILKENSKTRAEFLEHIRRPLGKEF